MAKPVRKFAASMGAVAAYGFLMCAGIGAGLIGASMGAQTEVVPTVDARVRSLLSELTLDEKITLLHGRWEDPSTFQGQAGYMPGVPRLGIPALRLADGPPGVLTRVPSTALTATMGLAATFSRADARANGELVAGEARTHGIDVVLQPFINIDRDFRYGRGYNTYGEDPLLTGQIGAEFVRGVQSKGIMAQAKHYIGYDTDADSVYIDAQTLHEIYVAPFADAVAAGVSSIMCSYNKINGSYACGNDATLNKILKGELGFQGFVTSDWGATHGTEFIQDGLDMEMPGPLAPDSNSHSYFWDVPHPPTQARSGAPAAGFEMPDGLPEEPGRPPFHWIDNEYPKADLKAMVTAGTLKEAAIDHAAARVLMQMERFGLLDGKSQHSITASDVEGNARIIRRTSEDAAVLLKNEHGVLPLKQSDLGSIVFIGPGAGQTVAVGAAGEKAVGLPEREIGTFQAMQKLTAGQAGVHLTYTPGNDMDGTVIPADVLSHEGKPGLVRTSGGQTSPVQTRTDAVIDFTRKAGTALPADTTASWKGTLTLPSTGSYRLHLQILGCYASLTVDGKRLIHVEKMFIHGDITQAGQDNILPTTDGLDNARVAFDFDGGPHSIAVEVTPDTSHNPTQVRLAWVTPEQQKADYATAIAAARQAKMAIVFAWSRGDPTFGLPGNQDALIAAIASVNPNTVVVLNVCQPVAMPWLSEVKAVLQMWWPGDEGGWATAKVLLGKVNPAGRLPFTWPVRAQDMPAADPAHPERSNEGVDGKTTFSEGIYVGYRWFDKQGKEPLFPFGYGLSYTNFDYSKPSAGNAADGGVDVAFHIKNRGPVAGDEVPQVYLGPPSRAPEGVEFVKRALAGFDRISLQPGESKTVQIHIPPRRLQYWSVALGRWVRASGSRKVEVGASERDVRLETTIQAGLASGNEQ